MTVYVARGIENHLLWLFFGKKPKKGRRGWIVHGDTAMVKIPDDAWPSVRPGECRRVMVAPKPRQSYRFTGGVI